MSTEYDVSTLDSKAIHITDRDLIGAEDVCWNCFALIREERETPSEDYLLGREHWYGGKRPVRSKVHIPPAGAKPTRSTEMGYPAQNRAAQPGTLFCECGMSGAFARYRHPWSCEDDFLDLLDRALATLAAKGVEFNAPSARNEALEAAREGFTWPDFSADEAIQIGIAYGIGVSECEDD